MSELYTPFYEWAAAWLELSLPEALVLCRVKRWGNGGCTESNETLSRVLKLSVPTVKRAIKTLLKKEVIKNESRKLRGRKQRLLLFNFERTNLPLFDIAKQGHSEPVVAKRRVTVSQREGHSEPVEGHSEPQQYIDTKRNKETCATPSPLPAYGQAQALPAKVEQQRLEEAEPWLREKSSEALKDLLNDNGRISILYGKSIRKILQERKYSATAKL